MEKKTITMAVSMNSAELVELLAQFAEDKREENQMKISDEVSELVDEMSDIATADELKAVSEILTKLALKRHEEEKLKQ